MATGRKQKIAVLGGGVGAMTTVFHLTNEPGWQDRYDITIYQMGWRLGGKGACGRNAGMDERIEEHGPHVWFGFYETAFTMLQAAYDLCRERGLTPDSPFQHCIPDAMRPKNHFTVMEQVNGEWKPWHIKLIQLPGEPGAAKRDTHDQLLRGIDWLLQHEETLRGHLGSDAIRIDIKNAKLTNLASKAFRGTSRLLGYAPPPKPESDSLLAHLRVLAEHYRNFITKDASWAAKLLAALAALVASRILGVLSDALKDIVEPLLTDDEVRRLWHILDIGIANLRGIFADRLLARGFEIINDEDYSAWMERHGCHVPWSPLIQGIYDTCFGFIKGKTNDPAGPHARPLSASMEAGTTLRGVMQMLFGYSGGYSYKMQSGMGDTIFAPIYLALRERGVKFEFFHKVENLGVNGNGIQTIDVTRQATVNSGTYEPLKTVKGMPCWPNQPFFDQLAEGDTLRDQKINLESSWSGWAGKPVRLQRGKDFDSVILGVSHAGLRWITPELMAASQPWRDMIEHIDTTQTQAFQVWCSRTSKEMGWPIDDVPLGAEDAEISPIGQPHAGEYELMSGYGEPINSWADMSQVLDKEVWSGDEVKSVQYIFGTLEDAAEIPAPGAKSDFPEQQKDRVKQESLKFMREAAGALFPSAKAGGGFDWSLLYDRAGGSGEQRFDAQYWRANIEPTERYVLSIKGTGKYRLSPGNSGFENLYLAGDWTDNGFNVGCVEAAALSGKLAAEAIRKKALPKATPPPTARAATAGA